GSAYMIGKTNRDHWHVYLCGPYETAAGGDARLAASPEGGDATASNSAEGSPIVHALSRSSSRSTVHSFIDSAVSVDSAAVPLAAAGDTTVEILMTGLDPDRMRAMYLGGVTACEGSSGGKAVERASGIANIYPDSVADSYLFTPCGFSLNGLQGDGYYTIHVTPEPHCSYASFETTINDQAIDLNSSAGIKLLVDKVAAVFGPASLTVTVFRARASADAVHDMALSFGEGGKPDGLVKALATGQLPAADTFPPAFAPVQGYKSVDRVLYEFDHYWLRYAYYTKAD
ncbi:spermidine resistance protein, partial [Coemansia sp. RSA 2320]